MGGQSVAGESKQTPTNSRGFDAQAFMQSMQNLKVEYEKKVDMDPRVVNLIDAFKNEYSNAARHSAQYSTESSAQWLRFVAGAGASAKGQVNLANGRLNGRAQGNAQAKLVLLEGSYRIVYEVPSYKGWQMHFSGQDLGAIIFELSCVFSGFVGAKVALTGAVEVSYEGNRAKVSPRQRDRNDRLSVNFDEKSGLPRAELDRARVVPARLNERPPEDMNGVEVKAEAFAGIEVGLEPSGQLKWLPPENRRQPVAFASLTLDVAVNAGAAASAQLTIYYLQGKFRIKVMARLCWGIGAKGALDFVVDAAGLFEFARWVFYQLAHAAFINLTYIAHNAFLAHSRLMYLLIVDGVGVNENSAIAQFLVGNSAAIARRLDEFQARLNRASERKKLVDAINALPEWLTYATPETRGMLLYSITRHYPETHSRNLPSLGGSLSNPEVQYLPEHKQAILNVMRAVSLRREWANVMEHMTEDGRKRADAGKAEGDVLRFLNYGYSLNPNLSRIFDDINSHPEWRPRAGEAENTYLQQYLEHRANLRERFPRGYQVAQYGTPEYEEMLALETDRLPEFAVLEPRWGEEDTGYA